MSVSTCCLKSFAWDGTPTGREGTLASLPCYITGNNAQAAVLYVHDLIGWKFVNARLLADHFAAEAGVTVYVPDFFDGDLLPLEAILAERWQEIDLMGYLAKNSREVREPAIFACATALRAELGFAKVGAVGYCYGGWAVLRLAAREHTPPLVDCVVAAHPSLVVEKDLDEVAVPTQVLSAAIDYVFTPELKLRAFTAFAAAGVPFDYVHFPGLEHGGLVRGDERRAGERAAMARGKNAAVAWFKEWLASA